MISLRSCQRICQDYKHKHPMFITLVLSENTWSCLSTPNGYTIVLSNTWQDQNHRVLECDHEGTGGRTRSAGRKQRFRRLGLHGSTSAVKPKEFARESESERQER